MLFFLILYVYYIELFYVQKYANFYSNPSSLDFKFDSLKNEAK